MTLPLLSSPEGGVGLELLVLTALCARLGVYGSTAAFSRREAPGERLGSAAAEGRPLERMVRP
ncbi:MAG: hypothetical protein HZB37_00065 [Planctomycetes bacterium]|nr:hypothetical protein [Planctomycetota bacterium]